MSEMVAASTTLATYKCSRGSEDSCLIRAARFVRQHVWVVSLISLALLLPCVWHSRIEAGDLASHVYNAWLVMLVKAGKAPGLWLARQWTNILFDIVLTKLAMMVGLSTAQRIAVGGSVLLFFWGAFSTVAAMSGKLPWSVTPVIAIASYGVIFHSGLFNYYLSLALSFFALAILWKPVRWDIFPALTLLTIASIAQPLPPIWVLATIAYVWVVRRSGPVYRTQIYIGSLAFFLLLRTGLIHSFPYVWRVRQAWFVTGADQAYVFGASYRLAFLANLSLWIVIILGAIRTHGLKQVVGDLRFQLYTLCVIGGFLLPDAVRFPGDGAYYGGIAQRFSLIGAVLVCPLLILSKPARWQPAALVLIAAIYFAQLYVDTGAINMLESRVEAAVQQLPYGQHVIGHFYYPPPHTLDISMILDRACIGRCFSYGNYEPSTRQFRVRALPNNSIVAWDESLPAYTQYFMADQGESLYEVSRCAPSASQICVRSVGSQNSTASLR